LQWVIAIAGFIGFISAVLGLVLSIIFEPTLGPAMAITATFFYLLAVFFSPEKGVEEAKRLVRAHRLWETYLVNKIGLSAEQIHEEAEKYEHLLSDELLDEVDKILGFPNTDPHGSPIPAKLGLPKFPLSRLQQKDQAAIAQSQINERISA